jgi:F-type H+-transporting ATPase subunit delta
MAKQYVSSAARRYSRALFELALESGRLDVVSTQIEALGRLADDAEFRSLLPDPRIDSLAKANAILGALGDGVDPLVRGLIESLDQRRRLGLILEIPAGFLEFADEAAGRLRGLLESSTLIEEKQVVAIEQALASQTGKQVSLHCEVVPELLGGVRVTLAGTRYDGSVRGRLDQITQRLAAAELG